MPATTMIVREMTPKTDPMTIPAICPPDSTSFEVPLTGSTVAVFAKEGVTVGRLDCTTEDVSNQPFRCVTRAGIFKVEGISRLPTKDWVLLPENAPSVTLMLLVPSDWHSTVTLNEEGSV